MCQRAKSQGHYSVCMPLRHFQDALPYEGTRRDYHMRISATRQNAGAISGNKIIDNLVVLVRKSIAIRL